MEPPFALVRYTGGDEETNSPSTAKEKDLTPIQMRGSTVTNLSSVRGESKAGTLSNSAKLLAGYMKATGVFDAKTLADTLAIPLRTIQRLKLEIACANDAMGGVYSEHGESAKDATCAIHGVDDSANSATGGVSDAPNAPRTASDAPRVCARIETPSGLLTHEDNSNPPVPPNPKTKRGSRLADDWALPDEWREWTEINFAYATDEQIATQADMFRDYWVAKPANATKLDWFATWKNWCRRSFAETKGKPRINNGRMAYDEKRARTSDKPFVVDLPTADEWRALNA